MFVSIIFTASCGLFDVQLQKKKKNNNNNNDKKLVKFPEQLFVTTVITTEHC